MRYLIAVKGQVSDTTADGIGMRVLSDLTASILEARVEEGSNLGELLSRLQSIGIEVIEVEQAEA
jgi:hypothetical protein